jgi:undecaprenyl-diphosphatase
MRRSAITRLIAGCVWQRAALAAHLTKLEGARMAVARNVWDFLEQRDLRLMRKVHRWRAPRWIRFLMLLMTRLGDGPLWYGLGITLLFCGGPHRFRALAVSGAAGLASVAIFLQIKLLSRRKRPCQIEPHCWSMITPPDQLSFPSGHTMTAFALAISFGFFYPELQLCLLLLAAAIAVSRIILGMHFLTDVLVGMLLGVGIGIASVWIFA